jgi:hypothetical protein
MRASNGGRHGYVRHCSTQHTSTQTQRNGEPSRERPWRLLRVASQHNETASMRATCRGRLCRNSGWAGALGEKVGQPRVLALGSRDLSWPSAGASARVAYCGRPRSASREREYRHSAPNARNNDKRKLRGFADAELDRKRMVLKSLEEEQMK